MCRLKSEVARSVYCEVTHAGARVTAIGRQAIDGRIRRILQTAREIAAGVFVGARTSGAARRDRAGLAR
jgi:hypothetical protein